MTTEERVSALEARIAQYDRWLTALTLFARMTPTGRRLLKVTGIGR